MAAEEPAKGIEYCPGVIGKALFRVSERYVAEHVAPLVESRRAGAAKLDLILRGIALLPQHSGKRKPGTVLRAREKLDYVAMHDLVRDPRHFSTVSPEDDDSDAVERDKKREWVREQLQVLEDRRLLVRSDMGDGRHAVTMLTDLGTGAPFDDPGAKATQRSYITIPGPVLADTAFREWGSRELAGFLCALTADRYARNAARRAGHRVPDPGTATWYRQAQWFNNATGYRPAGNVVYPFSTSTIERGLKSMRDRGYVFGHRSRTSPTGERLLHPRMIYTNHFDTIGLGAQIIEITSRERSA